MIAPNPFTPRSGMEPKIFIGREDEIEFFEKKLEEADQGRFNHYVTLGEWGIGKTSLLRYLKSISQERGSLCSYFSAETFSPNTSFRGVALHILKEVLRNIPVEIKKEGKMLKRLQGFGFQILGTGLNLNFHSEKEFAFDPQLFLLDGLLGLWEDVKEDTNLVTVLIDDVQNYKDVSGIFTILKNVLSHDEILERTKFLFVLSSTMDGWDQFLMKHHPIGRYFFPRRSLDPFSKIDTEKLIRKTLDSTGVSFSSQVYKNVWDYTQGHLFEIHTLCSALYDAQLKDKVGSNEWKIGYDNGLKLLGENVFDNLVREASEKEKEILYVLSHFDAVGSLDQIKSKFKTLGLGFRDIKKPLRRLVDKKIVENPERGRYFIRDNMFREYIKLKLK